MGQINWLPPIRQDIRGLKNQRKETPPNRQSVHVTKLGHYQTEHATKVHDAAAINLHKQKQKRYSVWVGQERNRPAGLKELQFRNFYSI